MMGEAAPTMFRMPLVESPLINWPIPVIIFGMPVIIEVIGLAHFARKLQKLRLPFITLTLSPRPPDVTLILRSPVIAFRNKARVPLLVCSVKHQIRIQLWYH